MGATSHPSPTVAWRRRFAESIVLVAVAAILAASFGGCANQGQPASEEEPVFTERAPVASTGVTAGVDTTRETIQVTTPPTSQSTPGTPLAGEWFLPDGTGSISIDEGAAITFIGLEGLVIAGPYDGLEVGDSVSLTLSSTDLVAIFGDDSGVESADLVFRPGDTDAELVMDMSTEYGDQDSVILTRRSPGMSSEEAGSDAEDPGDVSSADADAEMEEIAGRLAEGLIAYRDSTGRVPQASDLVPGGPVEPYIPGGWPINPFTGEQVVNSEAVDHAREEQPGDVLYANTAGGTWVRYWTSDGVRHDMRVDW